MALTLEVPTLHDLRVVLNADFLAALAALLLLAVILVPLCSYISLYAWSAILAFKLRSPPANWEKSIVKGVQANGTSTLFGFGFWQAAAVRRQLILQSNDPSYYSVTHVSRRSEIAISPEDRNTEFRNRAQDSGAPRKVIYGFFHPYANAGGGGERVLWAAVKDTLMYDDNIICAIYCGEQDLPTRTSPSTVLDAAVSNFHVTELADKELRKRIVFIGMRGRRLVDPKTWPRFTLMMQAAGSVWMAWHGISTLVPDVFVDTMGYPFAYPLVSWVTHVPVAAYVHYPVISKDMLATVTLKQSPVRAALAVAKLVYWRVFALTYTFAGSYCSVVMTNSSWTNNHMQHMWWYNHKAEHIKIVYPPCGTQALSEIAMSEETSARSPNIVYIAQFRPEKRHDIVLREFNKFYKEYTEKYPNQAPPHLTFVGTVRNDDDKSRVYLLRLQARDLVNPDSVSFVLDAPFDKVRDILRTASMGVNAMWNEHFGIVVVEYMSAGLIPVVHNSGGPKCDIVVPYEGQATGTGGSGTLSAMPSSTSIRSHYEAVPPGPTGFHFNCPGSDPTTDSSPSYDGEPIGTLAETLMRAFELSESDTHNMRARARESVKKRFSNEQFGSHWQVRMRILDKLEKIRRGHRLTRGDFD